ncbi:MAG: cytochrome bc1 complex diheme cytochrome c subunit [Mycobacteriales bacterium]
MSKLDRKARRTRLSGYAVLLIALSVVGTLYTALAAPSSAQEEPTADQSTKVQQGRDLFLSGCSTCHGLNLAGGAGGPSLIGVGASSVIFQVESGRMPLAAGVQQAARKDVRYPREQIDALAAYVQSNGGGPTLPEGDLTDGDLQLGGALFRTNCASCHNFAGSGGALTYGKYAPELAPANARIIYAAMQSGPESMPRYGDNQLTEQEKKSITRYVRYITEAEDVGGASLGRYGPLTEGLVAWIVGISVLVALTLWIGARS